MTEITIYDDNELKFNVPTNFVQYRLVYTEDIQELETNSNVVEHFLNDCINHQKELNDSKSVRTPDDKSSSDGKVGDSNNQVT